MSFLKKIFQSNPEIDLDKGQKAFNKKQYKKALKLFKRAHKNFKKQKSHEYELITLDNAALSAEKAELYDTALKLYFDLLITRLEKEKNLRETMKDLERASNMARLSQNPSISPFKLLYMKFLIYLSQKDFDTVTNLYEKVRKDPVDEYAEKLVETWKLIHEPDTFIDKKGLPQIDLPVEFSNIFKSAEEVMQRCSLCEVNLNLAEREKKENISKGDEFPISVKLNAYAPISINSINLKATKFRVMSSTLPHLPLKMGTGENYTSMFSLIPNLPGEWVIGPVTLNYSLPSEDGEYPAKSNTLTISVQEAAPALKIVTESETLEEDMEYIVYISVENIGKTALQDIEITLEIPEGVTLKEGTSEKSISTLVEGEIFTYEIKLQFDLEKTHFEGHVIRVNGYIEQGKKRLAKSSILLGGKKTN
ncbi:MAG: hypothetical protein ACTSW1_04070 [Candidatus Hodarchaeales archaeon]